MGGHDHHHGPPYKVPDYRIYKVEDSPELVRLRNFLKSEGLKDPWLRNEVWRYTQFGTMEQSVRLFFFRGIKIGFSAFLLTIAAETIYARLNPSTHHDSHH